jgi:outer membrane lipoprotein-sorting protein
MPRIIYLYAILLALTISGCGTSSTTYIDTRAISASKIQEIVQAHHARIQSMKGEGRISVATPEMSQSGSFILSLLKPDSVLINLQGPFGIKIGSVLVTRTEFLFYNSWENKLITGSTSSENLYRILHVRLDFDDLLNLFAGGTFLADDLHQPDETRVVDNQYVFIYKSSDSKRQYSINPRTLAIQKIQFIDNSGKLKLEQTFSNFEDVDGIEIPYSIRITQPEAQQMVSLSYSGMLVNTGQLQFSITIPSNVERIHW